MKRIFWYFLSFTILILSVCSSSFASDVITYELKNEKIKDVWLNKTQSGQYIVRIELNDEQKIFFSKLTSYNIGKRLDIIYNSKVLTSAAIRLEIDSGIIVVGKFNEEKIALDFLRSLKNATNSR